VELVLEQDKEGEGEGEEGGRVHAEPERDSISEKASGQQKGHTAEAPDSWPEEAEKADREVQGVRGIESHATIDSPCNDKGDAKSDSSGYESSAHDDDAAAEAAAAAERVVAATTPRQASTRDANESEVQGRSKHSPPPTPRVRGNSPEAPSAPPAPTGWTSVVVLYTTSMVQSTYSPPYRNVPTQRCLGFRVWGLGFRVQGGGLRIQGFRVQGS
jgi:hypothetical protein